MAVVKYVVAYPHSLAERALAVADITGVFSFQPRFFFMRKCSEIFPSARQNAQRSCLFSYLHAIIKITR